MSDQHALSPELEELVKRFAAKGIFTERELVAMATAIKLPSPGDAADVFCRLYEWASSVRAASGSLDLLLRGMALIESDSSGAVMSVADKGRRVIEAFTRGCYTVH